MHNNCNIKHKLNNRFKKINRKMEKRNQVLNGFNEC